MHTLCNNLVWDKPTVSSKQSEPGKYAEQKFSVLSISYNREPLTRNSQKTENFCSAYILHNHKQRNLKRELLACNLKNLQNREFKLCSSPFRNTSLRNKIPSKGQQQRIFFTAQKISVLQFFTKKISVTRLPSYPHSAIGAGVRQVQNCWFPGFQGFYFKKWSILSLIIGSILNNTQ